MAEARSKIVRVKKIDGAQRIIYGEVYAPYVLDTYGEFMLPEDIVEMAHKTMTKNLAEFIDTNHDQKANGSYPVESFIARKGDPDFKEGSWVMGVKVVRDDIWEKVERGELNGFSFQALVKPVEMTIDYVTIRDHVGVTYKAVQDGHDDHEHVFYVEVDDKGSIIGGWTDEGPDGVAHQIIRGSVTQMANGHNHRFSLGD
ncbi:DNA methyltransferase/prohead protease protein [Rhizobium phage RHph_I4]|nr:DNA methyltransferase/prohead protease protein [Rhizobium phage RHph_I4]